MHKAPVITEKADIDILYFLDKRKCRQVNQQMIRLLGKSPADVLGKLEKIARAVE